MADAFLNGPGGNNAPELAWKNEAVTSSFAEQLVNMDLTRCKGIFVTFLAAASGSTYAASGFIPVDGLPYATTYITSNGNALRRSVSATKDGVLFTEGTSGSSVSNTSMIPHEIYIIK